MGRIKGPAPCGVGPFTSEPSWSHCMHTEAVRLHRASMPASLEPTLSPPKQGQLRTNPSRCTLRVIPCTHEAQFRSR